jgi:hypothetical protein
MRYEKQKSLIAIRFAIKLKNGQTALAEQVNLHLPDGVPPLKQAHIWNWLNREDSAAKVPPGEYAIALAKAINFKLTPADFRGDLYPKEFIRWVSSR